MRISAPAIISNRGQTTYRVEVSFCDTRKILWFTLSSKFESLLTHLLDGPLLALLIPAMAAGEDIQLDGSVSECLLRSVSGPIQHVLKRIIPQLHAIHVDARDVPQSPPARPSGVATGFSAGIDSFCTLADHYYFEKFENFKVSHLLFNNVGSHGSGAAGIQLFRKRNERLLPAVSKIGLPWVQIDSNLDDFYEKTLGF